MIAARLVRALGRDSHPGGHQIPINRTEANRVERSMTAFKLVWALGKETSAPEVLVLVAALSVEVPDDVLSADDVEEVSDAVGYEVAVAVALVSP